MHLSPNPVQSLELVASCRWCDKVPNKLPAELIPQVTGAQRDTLICVSALISERLLCSSTDAQWGVGVLAHSKNQTQYCISLWVTDRQLQSRKNKLETNSDNTESEHKHTYDDQEHCTPLGTYAVNREYMERLWWSSANIKIWNFDLIMNNHILFFFWGGKENEHRKRSTNVLLSHNSTIYWQSDCTQFVL